MKFKKNYLIVTVALLLMFFAGMAFQNARGNKASYDPVYAMMESDASLDEKVIYMEKRVSSELGSLSILVANSDLCSNKYLNELESLLNAMNSTIDGYEMISDQIDSDLINEKYSDYQELRDEYDKMVTSINDEKYEDALDSLKIINELRIKSYHGIEYEITNLGNN